MSVHCVLLPRVRPAAHCDFLRWRLCEQLVTSRTCPAEGLKRLVHRTIRRLRIGTHAHTHATAQSHMVWDDRTRRLPRLLDFCFRSGIRFRLLTIQQNYNDCNSQ